MNDFEKIEFLDNEFSKYRKYCKCGHSIILPKKANKVICTFCGNYVYKTKQDEFKDRLLASMLKNT